MFLDPCERCVYTLNNIGFVANELDCTTYYRCEKRSDGSNVPRIMTCPPELYWSQDILTCVRWEQATCMHNMNVDGKHHYTSHYANTQ